jgi:hypothetical protein
LKGFVAIALLFVQYYPDGDRDCPYDYKEPPLPGLICNSYHQKANSYNYPREHGGNNNA